MNIKPKVSILIPVYNGQDYISRAIESCLSQVFKDIELIVIDDGSTDQTRQVISNYSNDPRCNIYFNDSNIGLPATLHKGLKLCNADWVARLDSDDIMHPYRLDIQYFFAVKYGVDICGSWARRIDANDKYLGMIRTPISNPEISFALSTYNPIIHPSVLINLKFLNKFNLSYANSRDVLIEDYDLWCRLVLVGAKFYNIPLPLIDYRSHSNSISAIFKSDFNSKRLIISKKLSLVANGKIKDFSLNVLKTNPVLFVKVILRSILAYFIYFSK